MICECVHILLARSLFVCFLFARIRVGNYIIIMLYMINNNNIIILYKICKVERFQRVLMWLRRWKIYIYIVQTIWLFLFCIFYIKYIIVYSEKKRLYKQRLIQHLNMEISSMATPAWRFFFLGFWWRQMELKYSLLWKGLRKIGHWYRIAT